MESRAYALVAGIFTALLGIAVAAAVWWLSGQREVTRDLLLVTTRNVTGLNLQAQVRYRGIRTGKVQAIGLNPDNPREIEVRVSVPEWIPVTTTTTARLYQQGVTGLSYVQLEDDGSGEPISAPEGREPRIPLKPPVLESLGDAAGEVVEQLKEVTGRLNTVLGDENLQRLSRTMTNLEGASASLDAAIKDVQPLLAATRQVLSEGNIKHVQSILANSDKASAQAPSLVAELRGLIGSLQNAANHLEGLGTDASTEVAGNTLPRFNQLLEELTLNSRQLARVLHEVEGSPQVLLLGRATPRPGPGEPGFAPQR